MSNRNKVEMKTLKSENTSPQKEMRRKEITLAETAALLVLQKKSRTVGVRKNMIPLEQRKNILLLSDEMTTSSARQEILGLVNTVEFSHVTSNQIVPRLAERAVFITPEHTLYHVLLILCFKLIPIYP